MAEGIKVKGLADLNRALRVAEKDVRLGIQAEYRKVAEPVRADAESLAAASITNIGDWSGMRVGVTQRSVFVVPKKRGSKNRKRRRPNLSGLLYPQMQKALDVNAAEVERRFNAMLFDVAAKFNRR